MLRSLIIGLIGGIGVLLINHLTTNVCFGFLTGWILAILCKEFIPKSE